MTGLSADAEGMVKSASAEGSVKVARTLRRYMAQSRWLQKHNRYRTDAKAAIKADAGAGNLFPPHLSAYVAASVPLHCLDGWSLLGKAVHGHTVGDAQSCTHLAYYAELRAAMCLLAIGGIGVFDRIHFVLDAKGKAVRLSGEPTTHILAWEALKLWSESSDAARIVSRAIRPHGIAMADWLSGYPPISTWGPIATAWLRSWSMDLALYQSDQDARNEASYRPSGLQYRRAMAPDDAIQFLIEFWRSCEPGDSPFAPLDRALLRSALRTAYGSTPPLAPWPDVVDAVVHSAGVPAPAAGLWRDFMLDNATHVFMDRASRTSPPSAKDAHLETLCRATLLLRVATGATRDYLHEAGITVGEMQFWWDALGQDSGLWADEPPADFVDLWADIIAAVGELDAVRPIPAYTSSVDIAPQRAVLTQAERLFMWGVFAT